MKTYLLPSILIVLLFTATSASAQHWRRFTDDRFEPRYCQCDRCYRDHEEAEARKKKEEAKKDADDDHYIHCYEAWKKMVKSEKKAWKAEELYYDYRPVAAERKMYKAEKKAWKSRRKEYEHEHERECSYHHSYYHDDHYYHGEDYYRDR